MGFGNFDSANLSVLAYARVNADGSFRSVSNFELLVPHSPGGAYVLGAPGTVAGQHTPIFSTDDLFIVTVNGGGIALPQMTLGGLDPNDITSVAIQFFPQDSGPPVDRSFSLIVMRPLIPT